jgi:hypothetical protein
VTGKKQNLVVTLDDEKEEFTNLYFLQTVFEGSFKVRSLSLQYLDDQALTNGTQIDFIYTPFSALGDLSRNERSRLRSRELWLTREQPLPSRKS